MAKSKKNDDVPFADWPLEGPWYKQTHHDFRAKLRAFVAKEMPARKVDLWDKRAITKGEYYPIDLHRKMAEAGLYACAPPELGPKHKALLEEYKSYGGTPPADVDYFHKLILYDEIGRTGSGALGNLFIYELGMAPIWRQGSKYLKELVARDVLAGRKHMCLCVSDPSAGSDVANMNMRAVKDGDDYILTGEKYWITGGIRADYYTLAARTTEIRKGVPPYYGITLFLVPKGLPGFTQTKLTKMGLWSSDLAYLVLNKVRVPAKNIIGRKEMGFLAIMDNFNHERFWICAGASRSCRNMVEESIKFARERKTFGKRLMDHQVIRHKIGDMIRHTEALHAYVEKLCYLLNTPSTPQKVIAAHCALCKVQASKSLEYCCREACQVFGGRSYLRGGRAAKVERQYREVRSVAIPGGSEEIMIELATKISKL